MNLQSDKTHNAFDKMLSFISFSVLRKFEHKICECNTTSSNWFIKQFNTPKECLNFKRKKK
jgi:hypothetical protein